MHESDSESEAVRQRNRWIKAFNRLEAAISHHKKATAAFATDADDGLYAARDRILRELADSEGGLADESDSKVVRRCEGHPFPEPEQSRCAYCHLPMVNHPIDFVMPEGAFYQR